MNPVTTNNPEETRAFAAQLAPTLRAGDVLALHGELGAGKTCFVQGLAQGLGVQVAVSSPTYTLINEYSAPIPLYHVDAYRLSNTQAGLDLGLEDYFDGQGITVIEWAERVTNLLPDRTVHIYFEPGATPDERRLRVVLPSEAPP